MPGPLLGTYYLSVQGDSPAFLVGPIFEGGDWLRIQAIGAIEFALPPVVLVSSPATGSYQPSTGGDLNVTFTIPTVPAGGWIEAYWSATGTASSITQPSSITIGTGSAGGDTETLVSPVTPTWSVSNLPLTSAQLADLNANGAGSFAAVMSGLSSNLGFTVNVSALTLTLVGAGFALPEGAYPPVYPASHVLDPPNVLSDAAWTGGPLVCPGDVPASLAVILLPDGVAPSFTPGHTPSLQPDRDTTFSPPQLAAAGASQPGAVYRAWFVFNDSATADYTLNSGSYSLTVTRYGATPMADPYVSRINPQFGVESSFASTAAATRVLNCIENSAFLMQPEQTKESRGLAGLMFDTDEDLTTEMSKDTVKGWLDTRDFGYILQSRYGAGSSVVLSGAAMQWTFEDNAYVPVVPVSYTYELPTLAAERAQGVIGCIWDGIKIETERDKQFTASFGIKGKQLQDNYSASSGQNDVQTVTVNGAPTGGTFYLVVDNMPTATIAYNAAASAVQTAIRAVGGDWSGATVSGSAGGPYTVTNVLGKAEPTIQAVYGALTGGTTPTVTVAHTTVGGMKMNASNKILPSMLGVAFAADLTTLVNAPTIVTDEFSTSIDIGEMFGPVWRQNTADTQFGFFAPKKASEIKDTVTLNMAYNAQVANFISNSRSGTKMYVRLTFGGQAGGAPQIGSTGYYHTVLLDVCGVVTWKANKDSQGNVRSVDLDIQVKHNTSDVFRSRWTVINDVASYAS